MSEFKDTPVYVQAWVVDTSIQPSAPPVNPNFISSSNINPSPVQRMDKFGEIVDKYKISNFFALKLRQLENYEIVIICDDSGSMSSPVTMPKTPFEPSEIRWNEAQRSLKTIVDIASIFSQDGIDIYYLNRKSIKSVTSAEDLETREEFNKRPDGGTPLGKTLGKVLQEKSQVIREKPLLIIIFTDGEPNDMNEFVTKLKTRSPIERIPINIVACTDDESAVGYLDELDKTIPNLDVCDDYQSECQQIQSVQGNAFDFTYGDYIVKILLGPIDQILDQLDEKKICNKKEDLILKANKLAEQDKIAWSDKSKRKTKNKSNCVIS
jgi:hypothetical protein